MPSRPEKADDRGLASGVFTIAQQIGGALGLAILSTLGSDRSGSLLADGTRQAEAIVSGYQGRGPVGAGGAGGRGAADRRRAAEP